MNLYVQIYVTKKNTYNFQLIKYDGNVLLIGNNYTYKSRVERMIRKMKTYLSDPMKYSRMNNSFTLRAGNNRIIGRSPEMEPEEMEEAIALLIKYGKDAELVKE